MFLVWYFKFDTKPICCDKCCVFKVGRPLRPSWNTDCSDLWKKKFSCRWRSFNGPQTRFWNWCSWVKLTKILLLSKFKKIKKLKKIKNFYCLNLNIRKFQKFNELSSSRPPNTVSLIVPTWDMWILNLNWIWVLLLITLKTGISM